MLHDSTEGHSNRKLICFKPHALFTSRLESEVCKTAAPEEMIAKLSVLRKRYFQDTVVVIALKIRWGETMAKPRTLMTGLHVLMPLDDH